MFNRCTQPWLTVLQWVYYENKLIRLSSYIKKNLISEKKCPTHCTWTVSHDGLLISHAVDFNVVVIYRVFWWKFNLRYLNLRIHDWNLYSINYFMKKLYFCSSKKCLRVPVGRENSWFLVIKDFLYRQE